MEKIRPVWRWLGAGALVLAAIVALLWQARARLAAELTQRYFRQHGIAASVEIGALGLSGVSGRFALGPAGAPTVSAERIELFFDPLRWTPVVVEARLVHPVLRARVDEQGRVTLPALQDWIDSLGKQQGRSSFVSDNLVVSLTGLRALIQTPAGALEIGGDARLANNLPVSLRLSARPAKVAWRDVALDLGAAALSYDQGGAATLRLAGTVRTPQIQARDLTAEMTARKLDWSLHGNALSLDAAGVALKLAAADLQAGLHARAVTLQAASGNIAADMGNGRLFARADLDLSGQAAPDVAVPQVLRRGDPALARAIAANLARVSFHLAGRAESNARGTSLQLTQPLTVRGASGGELNLASLTLSTTGGSATVGLQAALRGRGLPSLTLAAPQLDWRDGRLAGDIRFTSRFTYDFVRDAQLSGGGRIGFDGGRYSFAPQGCLSARIAALHFASDMARGLSAALCAVPGTPLLAGQGADWSLTAMAQRGAAQLPLPDARVDGAAARLAFTGRGGAIAGQIRLQAATLTDLTAPHRFEALTGTGDIALADWVWRGRLAVAGKDKAGLGEVAFTHAVRSGTGSAHIVSRNIAFAIDKLQPVHLSPLLALLRRTEGSASFTGDVAWTAKTITSNGTLEIDSLDFLTPLGRAHAVKTRIVFTSLLPPVTAPDQQLAIARIDWTLPVTALDLRFALGHDAVQVGRLSLDLAQGHAALGAFTVKLADPNHLEGVAEFKGVALNALLAASNLGEKVRMAGTVSAHVPFRVTPEGFRIQNGRLAADGPGRLSINRSLWGEGGAVAANIVQDMAYQALENLAFDQLTAELNSIDNGRLQIVFHVKGKSDPPTPQVAEIAIADILNGTATQKPLPLPSGTPIDLTLDTSLNFDELLKSYAEAWSKSLHPAQ